MRWPPRKRFRRTDAATDDVFPVVLAPVGTAVGGSSVAAARGRTKLPPAWGFRRAWRGIWLRRGNAAAPSAIFTVINMTGIDTKRIWPMKRRIVILKGGGCGVVCLFSLPMERRTDDTQVRGAGR